MGKIIYGGGVVSIRGKVGGNIHSRNQHGNYLRPFSNPIQPNSPNQMLSRGRFQTVSQSWKALFPNIIKSWMKTSIQVPDADGQNTTVNGYALYQMLNSNLLLIGAQMIQSPPTNYDINLRLTALGIDSTAVVAGPPARFDLKLDFAASPLMAGFGLIVKASGLVTPGTNTMKGKTRFIKAIPAGQVSPGSLLSAYEAVYGANDGGIADSKRIYWHIQMIDIATGMVSKGWTACFGYGSLNLFF